jgi:acylphosphatase
MKSIRIIISGSVQGVTFRQFVKKNADELGVRGFVRNLEDGTMEIVAEGRDETVNELLKRCKQGPLHSNVRETETREIKHQGFDGFKISTL